MLRRDFFFIFLVVRGGCFFLFWVVGVRVVMGVYDLGGFVIVVFEF